MSRPPRKRISPLLRWAVEPATSIKLLTPPLVLYGLWELAAPYISQLNGKDNPFANFFFVQHHVSTSKPDDPRYMKGFKDLFLVAYMIVFFSFARQVVSVSIAYPIASSLGLRKAAKKERFGEQLYGLCYWGFMGGWAMNIIRKLPSWYFKTDVFWKRYPNWDMQPDVKHFQLTQTAFWAQQLFVMVLGLEKRRKDFRELVIHHAVTVVIGQIYYLANTSELAVAIYSTFDIPDAFLCFTKILIYLKWETANTISFAVFSVVWAYFRHYLNFLILWSFHKYYHVIPVAYRQYNYEAGAYMTPLVRDAQFYPLLILQFLNLYWFFLILRVLYRSMTGTRVIDDRSDDEEGGKEQ